MLGPATLGSQSGGAVGTTGSSVVQIALD